jgi:hypothetical protein
MPFTCIVLWYLCHEFPAPGEVVRGKILNADGDFQPRADPTGRSYQSATLQPQVR